MLVPIVKAKSGQRGSFRNADDEIIKKVGELQQLLLDLGLLDDESSVDGIFGSQTAKATRKAYYG